MHMTAQEFNSVTSLLRNRSAGKTLDALRLVLVDGKSWKQAQAATGVHASTILRAMRKINHNYCPTCGRPVR